MSSCREEVFTMPLPTYRPERPNLSRNPERARSSKHALGAMHGGQGMASILARLREARAQVPAPFKESDLEPLPPAWSVLGDL
jgi:hypothetical protein